MYELKLVLIKECVATSIDHHNIPSYIEWLYHGDAGNFYRGIERFGEGIDSNPFDEGTSSKLLMKKMKYWICLGIDTLS